MAKFGPKPTPPEVRFWKFVIRKKGCWGWKGATCRGYGIIGGPKQSMLRAPRISYTIHFGKIPKGMYVLHKCDNRPCTKPSHLWIGTPRDNVLDMIKKGRNNQPYGERIACAKLTDSKVLELRKKWESRKYTQRNLAKQFDIGKTTTWNAIHKVSWAHV